MVFISCFALVPTAFADFFITYAPHLKLEASGITLYDGNPIDVFTAPASNVVHASDITHVGTTWQVTTVQPWVEDVPSERGLVVLERTEYDPDLGVDRVQGGAPVRGVNFDMVHTTLSSASPNAISAAFSMPSLGDPHVPSGLYRLMVVELPETKSVYDPLLDMSIEVPYTEDDFLQYLSNPDSDNGQHYPKQFLSINFEYVADATTTRVCTPGTEGCNSNVLFLPGVEGSKLYTTGDVRLWEPNINQLTHNVTDLGFDAQGNSLHDVYTKDIVNSYSYLNGLAVGDIYQPFTSFMNTEVASGTIQEWEAVPYDWRLSYDDILTKGKKTGDNISYLQATDTPYIIQELRRLSVSSRTGKVTIIAHSNGGLLTKALTEKLGTTTAAELIDKIIFVGVPQLGTPEAIASMLHGHGQSRGHGFIESEANARAAVANMPGPYNLLPSATYTQKIGGALVTFSATSSATQQFINRYSNSIFDKNSLDLFLTGNEGRPTPDNGDTQSPTKLNSYLLAKANDTHADLDQWHPPVGIQLYEIAGVGRDTISSVDYADSCTLYCWFTTPHIQYVPSFSNEGDGIVMKESAHTEQGIGYYFDIDQYWHQSGQLLGHDTILSAVPVTSLIDRIIRSATSSLPTTITNTPPNLGSRTTIIHSIHSPVSLDIYDDVGNHTGIATTTLPDGTVFKYIENNVPGVYYNEFGEVKYVFSDGITPILSSFMDKPKGHSPTT
jgi:pimeloyl-ACP methyl ester carboxylesterase